MATIERVLPAYERLRNYKRSDLPDDLLAGLTVAIILVPQSMAYALLAGMPPIYGLYASTVPLIVYALFGTSRHLSIGPFAIVSLLTFSGASAISEPNSKEYVSVVLLLALMAGVLQLALGLLRMGFVTNFISRPVLSGFVHASVVVIAVSQLEQLIGVSISGSPSTVGTLLALGEHIGKANLSALMVGASALAALVLLAKMVPRLPAPLVVAAASTLIVYLLGLDGRGVEVVGTVPQGLPSFSLPPLDLEVMRELAVGALTVAFISFISSISVAKAIAANEKYKIDSDGELRALGLANICAALFSGFPVGGSFSRTSLNYHSRAKSQLSSLAAALVVVITLLFLTPLFHYLPNAALAAIIIVAVFGLIDIQEVRRMFVLRRADGLAFLITFVITLVIGVQEGIVIGAIFALLAFIRRSAYPNIAELGYVEDEEAFLDTESFPSARIYPEALIIRFDASLYFANISFLEEWLISKVADRSHLQWIIINCRGVNSIDVTAIEGLEDLVSGYRSRGIEIIFARMKISVRERLANAGWDNEPNGRISYPTTRDALRAVGLLSR